MYTLTIGDKAYSSWSMRGWLMLAAFDLAFEEERMAMYTDAFTAMQKARAPALSVPQLSWDEGGRRRRIWDTMAIAETLAERHPEAGLWPADPALRRLARVLSAQMHSGFGALRSAAPMNLHREGRPRDLIAPSRFAGLDLLNADESLPQPRQLKRQDTQRFI
ncbi:MAG: glutathione S-transferase, partial [Pseudomonadota bacterium]